MDEVDRQYKGVDDLEEHLSAEYESGRVLRLSLKMAHVLERPQVSADTRTLKHTCVCMFVFHKRPSHSWPRLGVVEYVCAAAEVADRGVCVCVCVCCAA